MKTLVKYRFLLIYLFAATFGVLSDFLADWNFVRLIPLVLCIIPICLLQWNRLGLSIAGFCIVTPFAIYLPSYAVCYYLLIVLLSFRTIALKRYILFVLIIAFYCLYTIQDYYHESSEFVSYDYLFVPILVLILPGIIGFIITFAKAKELENMLQQICTADRTVTNACYNILTPLQAALGEYPTVSNQESHLLKNKVETVINDISALYQQYHPSDLIGFNITALRELGYVVRINNNVVQQQIPPAVRKLWYMSEARISQLVLANKTFAGPIEILRSGSGDKYILTITWRADSLQYLTEQDYDYLVVLANRLNGATTITTKHGIACFQVKVPIPS